MGFSIVICVLDTPVSEIKEDKCEHCGANLWKHGTREETVILPTPDQSGHFMRTEVIPVKCEKCFHINPIPYIQTGEGWTFQDTIALSAYPEIYLEGNHDFI